MALKLDFWHKTLGFCHIYAMLILVSFHNVTKICKPLVSQVHNFQKLKNISLKAINFLATKPKVTCFSETVFFHLHIPELLQFSRPCG